MEEKETITVLGVTDFRNQKRKFGIKLEDRRCHTYVIGKTGMGKTELLENMVLSDILKGNGLAVIDPHGEFAQRMLSYIPRERMKDVIYFNPADMEYPIAFNPLETEGAEYRHLVASGILEVFKKIWPDVWSARMEYILHNALLALLESPNSTLLEIMRLLSDKDYRKQIVNKISDPVVKNFWLNEFARYTQRLEIEALSAIQNKIGQFVSNPLIRNIIGQKKSTIDMAKIMNEKKILIVNLSKGRIGELNSALLGALIINRLQQVAMSRVNIPEKERKDFYLYVDEFQNFSTESFASILSEARKYHLDLILAHQYINQLPENIKTAIFGNVGTIISFRVGSEDALFMEDEFKPEFDANDLINLPRFHIYIKLMIDGVTSRAFSAETLPLPPAPKENFEEEIIENSRKKYSLKREIVEKRIAFDYLQLKSNYSKQEHFQKSNNYRENNHYQKTTNNNQPDKENDKRGISLEELLISKSKSPLKSEPPERKKTEVNISDLQKAIEESLNKQFNKEGNNEE